MLNCKIELKWAFYFTLMGMTWMFLEKIAGLHSTYLDIHPYLTMLFIIPAVWFLVMALKDKKQHYYNGQKTYVQGLVSGIVLSLFIALLSPLTQWVFTSVISPEYFPNVIKKSVELHYYPTEEEAAKHFNYAVYAKEGAKGGFMMGTLSTVITMIFLRSKS